MTTDGPMPTPAPELATSGTSGSRLRAAARSLRCNPLAVCFGPIFSKEMRVSGRQASVYWARGAFVIVLLLLLGIGYTSIDNTTFATGNAARLQQFQSLAPVLAAFVIWTEFLVLLFVAPMLTSPAISREKFARTLPALMTTPMSSAQIIFGKLCSGLVQLIILLLLPIPMLMAVRILGGLDARFVIGAMSVIVSSAVLGATLGLLFSCWHKKPANAAAMALVSLIAIMLIPPLVGLIVLIRTSAAGGAQAPPDWLFQCSAPFALGVLTAEMSGQAMGLSSYWWLTNVYLNLGISAIALLGATLALRGLFRHEVAGRPGAVPVEDPDGVDAGADATIAAETDHPDAPPRPKNRRRRRRSHQRRSRTVSSAPVLWRELRRGGRKPAIAIIGSTAGVLGLVYLYFEFGAAEQGIHMMVGFIGLLLLILQAANATAGGIANERETRTWETLLTTPLNARQILIAKTIGGGRQLTLVGGLMLFDFLVGVIAGGVHPIAGLHVGAIAISTVVFLGGTGTLMGLLFNRASTATVMNLLIGAGLWIGLPMLAWFMIIVSGSSAEELITPLIWLNPVVMTGIAMEGASMNGFGRALDYDTPNGNMDPIEFTALLSIPVTVGIGAGLGALGLAIGMFPARCGRLS